jgi:hypothetical protein
VAVNSLCCDVCRMAGPEYVLDALAHAMPCKPANLCKAAPLMPSSPRHQQAAIVSIAVSK